MTLTVVILTRRADSAIRKNLSLLTFADEILVVTDQEPQKGLVLPKKIRLLHHPLNHNFAAQRNYALEQAQGEWVLFIDEDEVVTPALAKEIQVAIKDDIHQGFLLRRLDRFYRHVLYHGETGHIWLLRLGRKNAGHWSRPVHERWEVRGPVGRLENPLWHHRANLTRGFLERMALYGPIDAPVLNREGKRFSFFRLFVYPKAKFIKNFFVKLGFLDGTLGLFHAYLMSLQSLTTRVYQWQKESLPSSN